MIDAKQAAMLAERWFAAWNAHDLDAILALYTDDFTMSSPYIALVAGEPSGRLRGKRAVGAYWRKALEKYPELHFTPLHVLAGVSSVTLVYRSTVGGRLVAEVLEPAESGLVRAGMAHYAD